MDDIELTFNAESVTKAFGKLLNSVDTLENRMSTMSKETTKSTGVMNMGFGGLTARIGIVAGALMGIRKIIAGMPEVGRTFNIIGDMLSRNLLWPLRQEIIPLLQKLLDWARENRAAMVRFGTVLANVFRAVANIVKGIIDILGNLWSRLSGSIERIFGITIGRMSDLANIAIFKLSAIFQYIMVSFGPIADLIGKYFDTMLTYVNEFTEGFSLGLGDLTGTFSEFMSIAGRFISVLDALISKGGILNKVFKAFGFIIGTVVKGALAEVLNIFDTTVSTLENLINRLQYFKAWSSDNTRDMERLNREFDKQNIEHARRLQERMGGFIEQTKTGGSTLIKELRAGPASNNRSTTSNQNNTFNITVNEAKNAKDTGEKVSNSVRDKINMSRIKAGIQ